MRNSFPLMVMILGLFTLPTAADEPLKPGYKINDNIRPFFREYRVTGPVQGEGFLLVCSYSTRPTAMIYTGEITPSLVRLIKKIDAATEKHKAEKMGSYVVLICDSLDRQKELKALAEKEKIDHTLLALVVLKEANPIEVEKEGIQAFRKRFGMAETTVILVGKNRVKACYAFRKGEFTDKHAEQIMSDLPKIFEPKQ